MKLEELKIKIASLAYESKIIREREQAIKSQIKHIKANFADLAKKHPGVDFNERLNKLYRDYHSLHEHRRSPAYYVSRLREENRFSQLAHAYLIGRPYDKVEGKSENFPFHRIKRLTDIINSFGGLKLLASDVSDWILGKK